MTTTKEPTSLYQKYRPTTLDKVLGQDKAIKQIKSWFKDGRVPHVVAIVGSSGVGKTTLARIMSRKLGCTNRIDLTEINAASERGIEMTRDVQQRINIAPMAGSARVWVFDECHKLSSDAQSSLLKTLEDMPSHAYFFLCTTDPQKLLTTIKTRCTFLELSSVAKPALTELVNSVIEAEQGKVSESVINKLVVTADGSPRRALVLLDTVLKLEAEEDQLAAIESPELEKQSWDLVKALLYEKCDFIKVAIILKGLENLEAEEVRRMVLACARTELFKVNRNVGRAFYILECFQGFSDTGKAGHAWLARAAYEVTTR